MYIPNPFCGIVWVDSFPFPHLPFSFPFFGGFPMRQKRQHVVLPDSTCCVCDFNVLCLRFQHVVFAISTCCVCSFNTLCLRFQRVVFAISTRCVFRRSELLASQLLEILEYASVELVATSGQHLRMELHTSGRIFVTLDGFHHVIPRPCTNAKAWSQL